MPFSGRSKNGSARGRLSRTAGLLRAIPPFAPGFDAGYRPFSATCRKRQDKTEKILYDKGNRREEESK